MITVSERFPIRYCDHIIPERSSFTTPISYVGCPVPAAPKERPKAIVAITGNRTSMNRAPGSLANAKRFFFARAATL
jgi:hypothetical protein